MTTRAIYPVDEQRVREIVREELLDYVAGASLGDRPRRYRHLLLFYAEMELHREDLSRAPQDERARLLNEMGERAHEQELDESRARWRAQSPDGRDFLDDLNGSARDQKSG